MAEMQGGDEGGSLESESTQDSATAVKPPFSSKMRRPLLDFLADKKTHSLDATIRHLADRFNLTEEAKAKYASTGRAVFPKRVIHTISLFRISGLLENESLANFKITEEGVRVWQGSDNDLSAAVRRKARRPARDEPDPDPDNPREIRQGHIHSLEEDLKSDLLSHINQCSPAAFEELVVKLLVKMGYGGSVKDAGKAVGRTGDGGIDGVIKEDELGLGKIYVQAKRWTNNVGDPEVQKFLGALETEGSDRGVLITTSDFTKQARERRKKSKKSLILIDGRTMAGYMIRYNLGVAVAETCEVKEIDAAFFSSMCGAA